MKNSQRNMICKSRNDMEKIFYLLLLTVCIVLSGCSQEETDNFPDPDKEEDPNGTPARKDDPKSIVINSGNITMPASGTITVQYSDSPSGNGIDKIVDNDPDSKFSIESDKIWIVWRSDEAFTAIDYFITSAEGNPENDPKSWNLSASNDNTSWKTLASSSNITFTERKRTKEFHIQNNNSYKYYKLSITANNGGTKIEIADWGLTMKKVMPKSIKISSENTTMPGMGTVTVQYDDSPVGDDIDKLIDGDANTKYTANYDKVWIVWKGNSAVELDGYFIASSTFHSQFDPKSWTLSASNDSISWKVLDTKTDYTFEDRKEKKSFPITDNTSYQYFKLDITANNGGVTTQIADWGLKKTIKMEDLMKLASGFTHSTQTPMGIHYENRHVTTDLDRAWLLDANNEPPVPGSLNGSAIWKELPVTLYPFEDPIPADINQHNIGDCGGIAALASMAYLYPDFIKSIITDNGDKTYTVDMFDPQGIPLKVTLSSAFLITKDSGNIAAVSGKRDQACWSTLLEKAIIKYNAIYAVDTEIGGIGSHVVPPLFTGEGESFGFPAGVLNADQLKVMVETSLNEGNFVVGGFNQVKPIGNTNTVTGHAYTYLLSTDPNALFSMRNPWGGNPGADGTLDGVLNIPDDGIIPTLIDVGVTGPGKAASMKKDVKPYDPLIYSFTAHKMRVSAALMESGM